MVFGLLKFSFNFCFVAISNWLQFGGDLLCCCMRSSDKEISDNPVDPVVLHLVDRVPTFNESDSVPVAQSWEQIESHRAAQEGHLNWNQCSKRVQMVLVESVNLLGHLQGSDRSIEETLDNVCGHIGSGLQVPHREERHIVVPVKALSIVSIDDEIVAVLRLELKGGPNPDPSSLDEELLWQVLGDNCDCKCPDRKQLDSSKVKFSLVEELSHDRVGQIPHQVEVEHPCERLLGVGVIQSRTDAPD